LFANATSLLGGRDFARAEHRSEVAGMLGIPDGLIPTQGSWAYDQILDGIESGAIRGLWIIATNTAASWIQQSRFQDLAAKLEFLVVQDLYDSVETVRHAHLVLPAAGWGEKEGTLINSERRIGLVKRVRTAPGSALADFSIFRLVAESWGCGELFRGWSSPEAVFQLLKKLSAGRPCDITGIRDYAHLDACGGIQWPYPSSALQAGLDPAQGVARERRLFEDGQFFTPDAKARFLFDPPRPVGEPVDAEYPLVMLTGRGTSAQWHTNTRTGQSAVLRKLYPAACYVEMNLKDAEGAGIEAGQLVRVISRRGELQATAFLTSTVGEGQIFVPMHYVEVNQLTFPSFDPHSRQPSYKHCAVRVERV
jgi:assimilatory nitrate reductase catalytic subunit